MLPAAQPTHPVVTAAPVASTTTAAPAGWQHYTVRAGDTLYDLARHTGTTTGALVVHNRLSDGGRHLQVGQVLVVPGTTAARPPTTRPAPSVRATSPTTTSTYRVRAGDTVEAIARRSGVTQPSLIKANSLRAPYLIRVGQTLRIVRPALAPPHHSTSSNTFAGRTYPSATVAAATAARTRLAAAPQPTRTQMRAIISATATRYGVDRHLALAVAYQESGWDQRQVSVANAVGAMQVIPDAGAWASQLAGRRLNLLDAHDNATAGVVILRALTRSAHSLDEAIAGYYQGLGSVQHNGMYADTKGYVRVVKTLMTRF